MSLFVLTKQDMAKGPLLLTRLGNWVLPLYRPTWRQIIFNKKRSAQKGIFVANLVFLVIIDALAIFIVIQPTNNGELVDAYVVLVALLYTLALAPNEMRLFNFLRGKGYGPGIEQEIVQHMITDAEQNMRTEQHDQK